MVELTCKSVTKHLMCKGKSLDYSHSEALRMGSSCRGDASETLNNEQTRHRAQGYNEQCLWEHCMAFPQNRAFFSAVLGACVVPRILHHYVHAPICVIELNAHDAECSVRSAVNTIYLADLESSSLTASSNAAALLVRLPLYAGFCSSMSARSCDFLSFAFLQYQQQRGSRHVD